MISSALELLALTVSLMDKPNKKIILINLLRVNQCLRSLINNLHNCKTTGSSSQVLQSAEGTEPDPGEVLQ